MLRDCEAITSRLAAHYGIPVSRIYQAHNGGYEIKRIRQEACYLCHLDGIVTPVISRCFGITQDTVRYAASKLALEDMGASPYSLSQFKDRGWAKGERK
jgi:hypothetical protein